MDGYRKRCIRHAQTTGASHARNGTLWLYKSYEHTEKAEKIVCHAIDALKGWERSPWYHPALGWENMKKRAEMKDKPIVCRGICWEGHPILAMAHVEGDDLIITTASPDLIVSGIKDLPFRTAAVALELHDFIAPEGLLTPHKVTPLRTGHFPIHSYLLHAMNDKNDPLRPALDGWPMGDKREVRK